jgi:hypothetical protein
MQFPSSQKRIFAWCLLSAPGMSALWLLGSAASGVGLLLATLAMHADSLARKRLAAGGHQAYQAALHGQQAL